MLCLPPPDPSFTEGSAVYLSVCTATRCLENAGRAFFEVHDRPLCEAKRRKSREEDRDDDDDEGSNDDAQEEDSWKKKKRQPGGCKDLLHRVVDGPNLYRILEVSEGCTSEDVRKAYRRLALVYHPDKNRADSGGGDGDEGEGDAAEELKMKFLQLQEAYEVLSDPDMRRAYDSALPFDDEIPGARDFVSADFFDVLRPVFERNAKWSTRRPVPSLGDSSTDMKLVRRFYDFWYEFDSWRDFSIHDEFDLNDAEFREERRWMERQNAKIRKKYEKEDKQRIQKLVELAYSRDPRILAEKEAARKKRQDEKDARRRAIEEEKEKVRKAEEEKRRLEHEERLRREEQEKAERDKRKAEKEHLKQWRQRLRKYNSTYSEQLVDVVRFGDLVPHLALDKIQQLCDAIERAIEERGGEHAQGLGECVGGLINAEIDVMMEERQREEDAKRQKAIQQEAQRKAAEEARRAAQKSDWTPDELSMLAKGLQKHPGGTARRWQLIAAMIGTKTPEEVIEKTKEMSQGQTLKSMGSKLDQVAFNQFMQHNKGAFKKIEAPADQRLDDDTTTAAAPSASASSSSASVNGASGPSQAAPPTQADGKQAPAAAESAPAAEWTADQQQALERALSKHPSSIDVNERWTAIAADVPGKNKKECLARFKEIREALLAKKKGGG
ncbi:unnamed protein product [Vitrella brassicaformis CCMP3155]|uniref:DnaJ homolog subfamily C member 2 n=2 Tax=Vitrella brassicaformis TaxID=1169539 RepID=A0A0G4EFN1_VITBC|nr:unnamed protein product [Vitrella brassicaformis CCMP3155]|eukprot:CEL94188.1 unnamed protein product [Vitrella brassicaformis CCMP3155]